MSNWHSRTIKAFKSKTVDELKFIIKDCKEALRTCGDILPDYKAGQYSDEICYAGMELRKRSDEVKAFTKAVKVIGGR